MLGARLGPYRIDGELGSGGMGTVYLASVVERTPRVEPGRPVALKVIHPHLPRREGFFDRFLREAEVGRLVRHDNVVRTLDVDVREFRGRKVHFLAMEYVEGKTLRELLDSLGTLPEALLRELGQQVARGLAAIHVAGIVHRDLKPENVLVTEDHQVRIMDLGMARVIEASVDLTHEDQFTGSVLYAAPERLRGEVATPQTDLYALGTLLHELAVGEHPFHRDEPVDVIQAHLHDVPPRLVGRAGGVSTFLSEVVDVLLAKDPRHRFDSADTLADLLREGERSAWWANRERQLRRVQEARPRIAVSHDAPLRGRAKDLGLLRDAWRDALTGRGAAVFLEGEAGIGKTRLVDAFVGEILPSGAHVLYGSYAPAGGRGGLSEALLTCFGAAGLEERLAPYLEVTPSLVPAFAAVVRQESAPDRAPPLRGDALQTVFVHLVRGLAEERPLLWVVDDLHNAEPDSRHVILSMVRALAGSRALLVLTARPSLPEEEIAHLTRTDVVRRIRLDRLSPREVVELLKDVLGSDDLVDHLGARIAYKSDGVPFFVFEMIQGLEERRVIQALEDGTYVRTGEVGDVHVSTAVRDLIASRLEDLSPEERDVLDVGAVQGYEFNPLLAAWVLGRRPMRVLQDLARVERRSRVVRPAEGAYRFDHHQIQEVIYGSLNDDKRRAYHTLLAEARIREERMEGVSPTSVPSETAVFLAAHHLAGRRPADARPYLGRALAHLGASYRNERLLAIAERALEAPGVVEGRSRVELLLLKAERLHLLGRSAEARATIDQALDLTQATWDRSMTARILASLGTYLEVTGHYAEAEGALSRARVIAKEASSPAIECLAIENLGRIATTRGRLEEAREHHEAALAIARDLGDAKAETEAIGSLGHALFAQGRSNEARERYVRWLDLAREIGNREGEAVAQLRLGQLATWLGDFDAAEKYLLASLRLDREIGARSLEGSALLALALLAHRRGEQGQARRRAEQALAIRREIGQAGGVTWVLVLLGKLWIRSGDVDLAYRDLSEASRLAHEAGAPGPAVLADCLLATLPQGDPRRARSHLDELGDRLDVAQRMEAHHLIWEATGDEVHLASAWRLLDEARREAPPSHREAMVEEVPLHRAIAEAWAGHSALVP